MEATFYEPQSRDATVILLVSNPDHTLCLMPDCWLISWPSRGPGKVVAMLAVADLQMTGSGGGAREEDEEEEDQLGAGARTRWGPPAGTSAYGVGELCSSLSWVMGRGTSTQCCNVSSRVY